jgi:3'-phosphoadenosine 5'-phosphosulfate (PAPS) 3'-phosphatase
VNIALIEGNSPIAGVVYVPVAKELFWGNSAGSFKAIAENETGLHFEIFSNCHQF